MPFITKTKNAAGDNVSSVQVRSFIAVAFTTAVIVGFFMKIIEPASFMNLAIVAVTWYFTKRQAQDERGDGDVTTTTTKGKNTTTTTTPNSTLTSTISG